MHLSLRGNGVVDLVVCIRFRRAWPPTDALSKTLTLAPFGLSTRRDGPRLTDLDLRPMVPGSSRPLSIISSTAQGFSDLSNPCPSTEILLGGHKFSSSASEPTNRARLHRPISICPSFHRTLH